MSKEPTYKDLLSLNKSLEEKIKLLEKKQKPRSSIEERNQLQEEICYRTKYEEITSTLFALFLNFKSSKLDEKIIDSIKLIAEFANASKGYILHFSENKNSITCKQEWHKEKAEDQKQLLQNISINQIKCFYKKTRSHKDITLNSSEDLPDYATKEKKWIKQHGFIPSIYFPIIDSKNKLFRIISIAGEINQSKEWSPDVFSLLSLLRKLVATILDRKSTEHDLRLNREKLRNIFESSPNAIIVYDANGKIIEFNQAAVKLHGFSNKREFSKKNCFSFISAKHKKRAQKGTRYLLKRGYLRNQELELIKKDGSTFLAEISTNTLNIFDNQSATFVSITQDISKRKSIERELKITQHSIDNAAFPIFWVKPDASFVYVNNAACKSLGYTKEEFFKMKVHDIDPQFPKEKWAKHWESQKKLKTLVVEAVHQHKNGEINPVELIINHFTYEGEEFSYTFVRNISERKEYERKLKTAKEKAEESDKLKSAFLANISHEIRTPMNAILGFSKLLTQSNLTKVKKNNFVNIINNSSNSLLRLIDDIIDISRIEAEQIHINKSICFINKMLDELYSFYKNKALNKDLTLTLQKEINDENYSITTDQQRINQILSNLLSNAIKFTDKGSVVFGYSIEGNNKIRFFVKDSGIGIPKNMQRIIFDRFRQVDNSNTRKYGGTGLGLTISKRMVNLLGGELWVESSIAKGAAFYFDLTLENLNNQANTISSSKDPKKINWRNYTILIAEDIEYNFEFLRTILEPTEVNIIWVKDGAEAVKIFKENSNIDLILMDIRMPEMNGYEATKQIKKIDKSIPIISQTAYAVEGEKQKSFEAGCDSYIAKPIRKKELFALIDQFIDKRKK